MTFLDNGRKLWVLAAFLSAALSTFANPKSGAAAEERSVTLAHPVQIPGTVLKPGSYTFSVEDTLQGRAIVRIASKDSDQHYFVLSVPSGKLPPATTQDGLIFFNNPKQDDTQTLRGWQCPGCASSLEFVYPKLEAVKITSDSGQSVLAVDPASDKLPANLSPDDMKVVTLWLLSPKRITPDTRGEGLEAQKYEGGGNIQTAQSTSQQPSVSSSQPPAENQAQANTSANSETTVATTSQGSDTAGNAERARGHLPKTASNTFLLALLGIIALIAGMGLRLRRALISER